MNIPNQLELKYVKDVHPYNLHCIMLWEFGLIGKPSLEEGFLPNLFTPKRVKHSPRPLLQVLGCDRDRAVQTLRLWEQIEKLNHFQQEVNYACPMPHKCLQLKQKSELKDKKFSHEGKLNEELQLMSQFLRDAESDQFDDLTFTLLCTLFLINLNRGDTDYSKTQWGTLA